MPLLPPTVILPPALRIEPDVRATVPFSVKVFVLMFNAPEVSVSVPASVSDSLQLNPALLFSVILLIVPVNRDAGIVCAVEPPNTTVADALLASIFPDVRLMLPLIVSSVAPIFNVPEVNASVFPIVKF